MSAFPSCQELSFSLADASVWGAVLRGHRYAGGWQQLRDDVVGGHLNSQKCLGGESGYEGQGI